MRYFSTLILVISFIISIQSAKALKVEVKPVNGVPLLLVDEQPKVPMMFWGHGDSIRYPTIKTIGTEWSFHEIVFKAFQSDVGVGVHLRVGETTSTVWVDGVEFQEEIMQGIYDRNQVREGGFETPFEVCDQHWDLWKSDAEGVDADWSIDTLNPQEGNQCCRISIRKPGKLPFHAHLIQQLWKIQNGKNYRFRFWLRADRERKVEFQILHHGEPWTRYSDPAASPFVQQAKLAAGQDIHIHSFAIPFPWPDPGKEVDYTAVDRILEDVLAADPKALMLPRFGMNPPGWWLDSHPDEVMTFSDGKDPEYGRLPSIASVPWRQEAADLLRKLVRHCESRFGDHMLGYHPCGQNTAEWFYERSWDQVHHDLDEAFRKGFIQWVGGKYGNLANLNQAWQTSHISFEQIQVPAVSTRSTAQYGYFRDPLAERYQIDFQEYQNVAVAEVLELFAKCIKEETQRQKLAVFFYGYLFELAGLWNGPQYSGHMSVQRILACPDIDILCAPMSYYNRGIGGIGAFMSVVDSIHKAGKLWLTEDDTRTYLATQAIQNNWVEPLSTLSQTISGHQRNFAHLLPRRLATWYMDLENGGWLNSPEIWANLGFLHRVYQNEIRRPMTYQPQVAVIVDETSTFYLSSDWRLTRPLYSVFRGDFYRIGTPFSLIYLHDVLKEGVELPPASLFIGCFRLTQSQRAILEKKLAGKTAIWMYGSGFLDEDSGSVENMEQLTGLDFTVEPGEVSSRLVFDPTTMGYTKLLGWFDENNHSRITWNDYLSRSVNSIEYAPDLPLNPNISIQLQEGAVILAKYRNGKIAAAKRTVNGRTDCYIGSTAYPACLLRDLIKEAGVHLYIDSDDVLMADREFVSITATQAGEKILSIPNGTALRDIHSDIVIPLVEGKVSFDMEVGNTRQFFIEPREKPNFSGWLGD